jgi:hypothetical protein
VDVVRRIDLQGLALRRDGPCVSLFLPTHRAGREVEQAPIRLKNLLRQTTDALQADGARAPEIGRLLAPLRRLPDDRLFWQSQSDGLLALRAAETAVSRPCSSPSVRPPPAAPPVRT